MMKDIQGRLHLKKINQSNKAKGKLEKQGKMVKKVKGFGGIPAIKQAIICPYCPKTPQISNFFALSKFS